MSPEGYIAVLTGNLIQSERQKQKRTGERFSLTFFVSLGREFVLDLAREIRALVSCRDGRIRRVELLGLPGPEPVLRLSCVLQGRSCWLKRG